MNATTSARWQNLVGCQPAQSVADRAGWCSTALPGSPAHCTCAPRRAGVLGKLALMKGDLPPAEQRLAALDKARTFGREQYTDLKQAIQRCTTAGNRYQPAP